MARHKHNNNNNKETNNKETDDKKDNNNKTNDKKNNNKKGRLQIVDMHKGLYNMKRCATSLNEKVEFVLDENIKFPEEFLPELLEFEKKIMSKDVIEYRKKKLWRDFKELVFPEGSCLAKVSLHSVFEEDNVLWVVFSMAGCSISDLYKIYAMICSDRFRINGMPLGRESICKTCICLAECGEEHDHSCDGRLITFPTPLLSIVVPIFWKLQFGKEKCTVVSISHLPTVNTAKKFLKQGKRMNELEAKQKWDECAENVQLAQLRINGLNKSLDDHITNIFSEEKFKKMDKLEAKEKLKKLHDDNIANHFSEDSKFSLNKLNYFIFSSKLNSK
jgi:hypothetical protein